jgi:hypothetical protein
VAEDNGDVVDRQGLYGEKGAVVGRMGEDDIFVSTSESNNDGV